MAKSLAERVLSFLLKEAYYHDDASKLSENTVLSDIHKSESDHCISAAVSIIAFLAEKKNVKQTV